MTLGTPPQPFRAIIDISFPDVIVTSSECLTDHNDWEYAALCNGGHYQYHPTWSRTGVPSTKLFFNDYPAVFYEGRVTKDVMSIAGLEISDQSFHEALDVRTPPIGHLMDFWDGVLGLAIDDAQSPVGLKGPLTNMIEQGLIDTGIVSILLGRGDNKAVDSPGEIAFGGVNEDLIRPNTTIKFLPVSNRMDPPDEDAIPMFNSTWQVEAQYVEFTWFNETSGHNETVHHDFPAETGTARFDTIVPTIALPPPVGDVLRMLAKPRFHFPEHFMTIPCTIIPTLPTLVFKLGGEVFLLPPEDYVLEDIGNKTCIWTIESIPPFGGSESILPLGSAFLRSFYVVLDRDRRNIGFAEPAWKDWYRNKS
ncbi:acid protease [Thozetella sp. PMI_491]|nr:acid protease [Thozetella sp. PMI_491]